jgi:hypothetical protein
MMAKSIDQQIKDAMAKKVVGRTTEIYKGVVLELYKRITANSLQVGIAYGSPVLTGRYYASHTVARGTDRQDRARTEPRRGGESLSRPAPDQCGGCTCRLKARANHLYGPAGGSVR